MYVLFEGIDGVGKSTQIEILASKFNDVVVTKEPGGTQLGVNLREILLSSNIKIGKRAEILNKYDEFLKNANLDEIKKLFGLKELEESKRIVENINESSVKIQNENSNVIRVVENLSAIAEENAATTEEVAASVDTQVQAIQNISQASESLADIASQLQSEVSKFNL